MPKSVIKRIFMALLVVLAWFGFVVEGSHALFSDQVVLNGNAITTGTTNLLISNSQNASSTLYDKSRPGFTAQLSPGESYEKYFLLKNSSDGNLDFRISLGVALTQQDGANMSEAVMLSIYRVDDTGAIVGTPIVEGALKDLLPITKDTSLIISKGEVARLKLVTKLAAGYTRQGQAFNYDLIFYGTQVTS